MAENKDEKKQALLDSIKAKKKNAIFLIGDTRGNPFAEGQCKKLALDVDNELMEWNEMHVIGSRRVQFDMHLRISQAVLEGLQTQVSYDDINSFADNLLITSPSELRKLTDSQSLFGIVPVSPQRSGMCANSFVNKSLSTSAFA